MSNIFQFKEFNIIQDVNPQKVGTDSMLLGAWTSQHHNKILDIGTGTGILALMAAQKNPTASITAIEPDVHSMKEAELNFRNSKFSNRILAINTAVQNFGAIEKFDLIISNPPYFENAFLSEDSNRNRARHTNDLPIHEFYLACAELLSEKGTLSIIIPSHLEETHIERALTEELFPKRILRTRRPNGVSIRTLIEYSFSEINPTTSNLLVKDQNGKYSSEYINLTKDFYGIDLTKR
ncbi:tRNA1(Val) (adenine(37)-N6)-methyltransferase [Crocinitomix algicola]|uniref:tRNA1(Val) (adenine(37)-N6)-methyltransferase n=1 Tax=Crocinitomix algicola TaxID=1740263 RepID=UPI0008345CA5|nr:methyltransferase [Crocinitomix algicola]